MTISASAHQRDGTLLSNLTDLVLARFTERENDIGEGAITLALDNADIADLANGNFLRIRNAANPSVPIEIRAVDTDRQQPLEHAGQLRTASGPGAAIVLGTTDIGGAVVYPESGVDGFKSDIRYVGWMSCTCFDHATYGFTSPPTMAHRQDSPVPPWTDKQPENWPDPAAYRIFCAAPTQSGAGVNEVQSVALGDSISSGTFTLTFDGQTTSAISSPWSAANVETALEALSNIDGVTVTGAGTNASPYNITFDGTNVASKDVPLLSVDHSSLIHTPSEDTVVEVTKGVKGTYATAQQCCYFYKSFTTGTDQELILFVNMYKRGEVYIDGVEVYRQDSASGGKSTQVIPIDLPAGTHCITAKVCKKGTAGAGWFMATLAVASENEDGGFDLGSVAVRTDTSWSEWSTAIDAAPPGVTSGAIMDCFMTEAQALSPDPDLDDVTWSFTPTVDTDSAAFTEEIVYGFKVGKGLLEVLQELMDMTGYSFRMNPDLSLDIWIQRGTDRTATVVYDEPPALEIVSSSYTRIMPAATTLLIETQNGLSEAKDAAGVTAYGSRRIGTTTGTAPTFEGLASFVTTTFDKHGNEKQELTLSTHGPAGLEPYADYDIGDWITAPDDEGVAREWRVTAIQMEMLEDGQPLWTVTLLREDAPA